MKTVLLLLASVAAALPAPASAAPPARQPAGKWVVDYAETNCSAARAYGTDKDPLTLAVRMSPRGNIARLIIARPGRRTEPHHFPVKLNALPADAGTTALRFTSQDRKSDLFWVHVDRAALGRLREAGELVIRGKTLEERIALPGFGAVVKALDACAADLREYWNANEADPAKLGRPAAPVRPLADYVSARDYPAQAIREDGEGAAQVTLMVDDKGALKECMVEQTSGIASLDVMTCAVFLDRAKFTPATDAAGKPLRSVLTTRIRWQIGG